MIFNLQPPQIIFENHELLVLNKPSGLSVTPGPYFFQDTLAGWVRNYLGEKIVGVGLPERWGIVHRLDKDTSGVLLIAKTQKVFEELVGRFKKRQVDKEYLALVWGKVSRDEFIIDAPIARHPKIKNRFAVVEGGRQAQTRFRVVGYYPSSFFTLIKAFPKTGRTHQIRVHLKSIQHPIVGDSLYQGKRHSLRFSSRLFLHAQKIKVILGRIVYEFESELPDELKRVLSRL